MTFILTHWNRGASWTGRVRLDRRPLRVTTAIGVLRGPAQRPMDPDSEGMISTQCHHIVTLCDGSPIRASPIEAVEPTDPAPVRDTPPPEPATNRQPKVAAQSLLAISDQRLHLQRRHHRAAGGTAPWHPPEDVAPGGRIGASIPVPPLQPDRGTPTVSPTQFMTTTMRDCPNNGRTAPQMGGSKPMTCGQR